MRIALIGTGRSMMTTALLPAVACDGHDVVLISRTTPELAHKYGQQLGITASLPFTEGLPTAALLRREGVEAAIVSTPSGHHYDDVSHCLRSGIATLVDKPPCLTPHQLAALADLEVEAAAPVVVGVQRRLEAPFRAMRQWVRSAPAPVSQIDAQTHRSRHIEGWRTQSHIAGGGALFDAGYHHIDLINWFLELDRADHAPRVLHARVTPDNSSVETAADVHAATASQRVHVQVDYDPPDDDFLEQITVTLRNGDTTTYARTTNTAQPGTLHQTGNHPLPIVEDPPVPGRQRLIHALQQATDTRQPHPDLALRAQAPTLQFLEDAYRVARRRHHEVPPNP